MKTGSTSDNSQASPDGVLVLAGILPGFNLPPIGGLDSDQFGVFQRNIHVVDRRLE